MKLVDIITGCLFTLTVCEHSVPDSILNDEHTNLFELIAKLLNIETYDTIAHINIGAMIKEVLAAVYEHFKGVCHSQCNFALDLQLTL